MTAALLAIAVPLLESAEAIQLHGGARAYFESAYQSSSGRISYTKPVAEQWGFLSVEHEDYGQLATDFWLGSALNDQTDSSHRRAFYCYEGTLTYGNSLHIADDVKISAWGGSIWDWLGGYKSRVGTPAGWITEFKLDNPFATPYINALGFFTGTAWTRIRFGLRRTFRPFDSFAVIPFADTTWGDGDRFQFNYGEVTDRPFLRGSMMFVNVGLIAEWTFYENFYLWGRFKQYVLIDDQARRLMRKSDAPTARTELSMFGLGVGFRF